MATPPAIDFDALSLDQLEALAREEFAKGTPPPAPTEPTSTPEPKKLVTNPVLEAAKVEDGKLPATGDVPLDEPDDPEDDEVEYEREIDLGDGSGVQVFRGKSLEELVDKLAEAQLNASRKIRELSAEKKTQTQAAKTETKVSEDEEWALGQDLLNKPTEAIAKVFEKLTGQKMGDFKGTLERVAAFEKAQAANRASIEFVKENPDYNPVKENGELMTKYLTTFNLPGTKENLSKAFAELKTRGLLVNKEATSQTVTTPDNTSRERIAPPSGVRTVTVRRSSGLTTRRNSAPVRSQNPAGDDLYTMPEEQLAALADAELRGQRG